MLCWICFFFAFQAGGLNLCMCLLLSKKLFSLRNETTRKILWMRWRFILYCQSFQQNFQTAFDREQFCRWRFSGKLFSFKISVSYYFDAMMFAFVFKLGETFHRAFPRINHNVAFEVSGVFGAFMSTSSCWEMSSWKCLTFKE